MRYPLTHYALRVAPHGRFLQPARLYLALLGIGILYAVIILVGGVS